MWKSHHFLIHDEAPSSIQTKISSTNSSFVIVNVPSALKWKMFASGEDKYSAKTATCTTFVLICSASYSGELLIESGPWGIVGSIPVCTLLCEAKEVVSMRSPFDGKNSADENNQEAFDGEARRAFPELCEFLSGYTNPSGSEVPPGSVKLSLDGSQLQACLSYPKGGHFAFVALTSPVGALGEIEYALVHDMVRWLKGREKPPSKK
jgi:hypothetical protein